SSRVSEMGTMIATLAHELTQPISAVTNYIETCTDLLQSDRPTTPETLLRGLNGAEAQAVRASEIIGRLLAYITKNEPPWQACDLNALVWDAGRLALPGPQRGGMELKWDLADHLPAVLGDPVQIQQVVVNLVRNAYEAMSEDEALTVRRLTISTQVDDDGAAVVSIADTGRGIDENVRESMWEPFAGGRPQGMGLGLSICQSIVTAHGGHVWAESGPEGGTAFRVRLPPLEKLNDAAD
ncbi:MAG: PAS domain-containing sensor histidine kinase, partial [Magnetospirillum sp.]|nr:PAS domain-containing sensor histidine kinase [Magnetospirillum sp.]